MSRIGNGVNSTPPPTPNLPEDSIADPGWTRCAINGCSKDAGGRLWKWPEEYTVVPLCRDHAATLGAVPFEHPGYHPPDGHNQGRGEVVA